MFTSGTETSHAILTHITKHLSHLRLLSWLISSVRILNILLSLIFFTEISGRNGLNGELCERLKEGGLKALEAIARS